MKNKIVAFLLSFCLVLGQPVLAAQSEGLVVLNVADRTMQLGEGIAYQINYYSAASNGALTDYTCTYDETALSVDKENNIITGLRTGVFPVVFESEAHEFAQTILVSVNSADAEVVKGDSVWDEDFEGSTNEFSSMTGYTLVEESETNHYMVIDGNDRILYSPLFGDELSDYIFEADIKAIDSNAYTTSQLSVGMRAQADTYNTAYRFANHRVIKYSGGATVGGDTKLYNAFSISHGGAQTNADWYYGVVKAEYDDMVSGTGHNKPYRWQVQMLDGKITGKLIGSSVSLESDTQTLDAGGDALDSGKTSIAFHGMKASFDNMIIYPIKKVDELQVKTDKQIISGKAGDNSVTYSVVSKTGETQTVLPADYYTINCAGATIDGTNKKITFPAEGEYDIKVTAGTKTAIMHISVAQAYEQLATAQLALPESATVDFALPAVDGIDVFYQSSDPEIIEISDNRAIVTRPGIDADDTTVTIDAYLIAGNACVVKSFDVVVKKQRTDAQAVADAIAVAAPPSQTSGDITLPTSFDDGVTCTWQSSDESIISTTGAVTRPEKTTRVRLSATFRCNGQETVKTYDVRVEGTSGEISEQFDISIEKMNYPVNTTVPVNVAIYDNLGKVDVQNVNITAVTQGLSVDSAARTVTASAEGVYKLRVGLEDYGVEKELSVAFYNSLIPAASNVVEVYSENFDSGTHDPAFDGVSNVSATGGKLKLAGVGTWLQSNPFGPRDADGKLIPLGEYIFDADVNLQSCNAGSTGYVSVGLRFNDEDSSSYNFANHEVIKYDADAKKATDAASQIGKQATFGYGIGPDCRAWSLPVIKAIPGSMFSGRGYNKPYHWRVMITNGSMIAQMSDIASGEKLFEMATPLKTLKNTPTAEGHTVFGAWSTDAEIDNITLSTMSSFDIVGVEKEQLITDQLNQPITIDAYTLSGEVKTPIPADEMTLTCDDANLEINENTITPLAWGEYTILVSKASKTAVFRLVASENAVDIEEKVNALSLGINQNNVKEDFALPVISGYDIQWISGDEAFIQINGGTAIVNRPPTTGADRNVVLTAIVTNGSEARIKNFNLNVRRQLTDAQAVKNAKDNIAIPTRVSSDITLPTSFEDGVTITWKSSSSAISSTGDVKIPAGEDKNVTLTATYKRGNETITAVYNVVVEGRGSTTSAPGTGSGDGANRETGGKTPVVEAIFPVDHNSEVFSDLAGYDWAKPSILRLESRGVVSGRGDGTFDPGADVTREEFVTMICGVLRISAEAEQCFSDVETDAWYAKYITAAVHKGIISGRADGSFGVGESITRQDMAVIIAKAMDYTYERPDKYFADDSQIDSYAKDSVYMLYTNGVVVGDEYGNFNPKKPLTRAEASVVLDKIS